MRSKSKVAFENFLRDLSRLSIIHKVYITGSGMVLNYAPHDEVPGKYVADQAYHIDYHKGNAAK